jgi:hypothetical protein
MRTTTNYALSYPESVDHTRTWEYWQSIATQVDALLKARFVEFAADGSIAISSGGVARPLPFAQAAGKVAVNLAAAYTGWTGATFPASRFTQTPLVTVASTAGDYFSAVSNLTPSGCAIWATYFRGSNVAAGLDVHWHAIQMTPGAAAGVLDADAVARIVVCNTPGCANEGIEIELSLPAGGNPVVCGVCGVLTADV